jgi:hypothetical protein
LTSLLHLPLTLEQEWFFNRRITDGGVPMLLTRAYDITGELDVDRLLHSFDAVIRRHQGMRSSIVISQSGDPNLVIHPEATRAFLILQAVTARSRDQFEAYARGATKADITSRWNPITGPVYRFRLLRRSAEDHILLGTFDHLAFDDRAVELFFHYLWSYYSDPDGTSADSEITDNSIDLASSIRAEHERYAERASGKNPEYWASLYAQVPEDDRSPSNDSQPGESDYECSAVTLVLNSRSLEDIRSAAAAAGVSMLTAYASVFAWIAFRLIEKETLAIYVPFDNRRPADRLVIGNFACVRPLIIYKAADNMAVYIDQIARQLLRSLVHRHMTGVCQHRLETAAGNARPSRDLALNYMRTYGAEVLVSPTTGLSLRRAHYAPRASTRSEAALVLNVREGVDTVSLNLRFTEGFLSADQAHAALSSCVSQLTGLSSGTPENL